MKIIEPLHNFEIEKNDIKCDASIHLIYKENKVAVYEFKFQNKQKKIPETVVLKFKIPAINIKGVWKPNSDFNKRIMADWELEDLESRISVGAPVINIFGQNDDNIITVASSDAVNTLVSNALYKEEDNHIYLKITFFSEKHPPIDSYCTQIRIDQSKISFSESIKKVGEWWGSLKNLKPAQVPELAKEPVYSTWYQFHQKLNKEKLILESKIAVNLGYKLMIIDDGWQTNDENRGYDYTGDWKPERFSEMNTLVKELQATGIKVALWFAVPFMGEKSKAFPEFKEMLLVRDHRWAPVLDPRYPKVRSYLVQLYVNALINWNLDGFKLDFIDDFKWYPGVELTIANGRDYASVNEAVDRLMGDIYKALIKVKPEVVIEFRQKYTGPAMRKYGNMFRAFDCPGDYTMNRVRIADLKMLSGDTAIHADMFTYHENEPLEYKALQLVNTLFGVPQLSIRLENSSSMELKMLSFYTNYWNSHKNTLLNGEFTPKNPLANYPVLQTTLGDETIIGLYDSQFLELEHNENIHLINGQIKDEIFVKSKSAEFIYNCTVLNCMGEVFQKEKLIINFTSVVTIKCPPCGIVKLDKVKVKN